MELKPCIAIRAGVSADTKHKKNKLQLIFFMGGRIPALIDWVVSFWTAAMALDSDFIMRFTIIFLFTFFIEWEDLLYLWDVDEELENCELVELAVSLENEEFIARIGFGLLV